MNLGYALPIRKLIGILGFVVMAVSGLFIAAAVGDLIGGSTTDTGVLVGLLIFFTLTGGSGFHLFRSRILQAGKHDAEAKERQVLQYAKEQGGRVTIAGVAAHTELSVAEAKKMLETLSEQGVADVAFDDDGAVFYELKGLGVSAEARAAAKNPLRNVAAQQQQQNRQL